MESTHLQSGGFRTPDRWNSVPIPERVAQRAYENAERNEDGCWVSNYSTGSHGYAQIGWAIPKEMRRGRSKNEMVLAHRAAWVHVNGQLPLGMTLDHICKVRRCVNPDHLRLLPNFENARRVNGMDWPMGQCANGHPNSLLRPGSSRRKSNDRLQKSVLCSECRRIYYSRSNWRTRHPGEPLPERLLLASEKTKGTP